MWSYPVIQDGLIYVVDLRNGLYILKYNGPYEHEVERDRLPRGQLEPGRRALLRAGAGSVLATDCSADVEEPRPAQAPRCRRRWR